MASELTQEQEMTLAYEQKRQPNCVYCKHPLDVVREAQTETLVWTWDRILKQYKKSEEGCGDEPYHYCEECKHSCEAADWSYIDGKLIDF
jgi:hypothetical protein